MKREGVLPNSSQPPSGLGFRPAREASVVRSHAAAHATGPSGFGARGGRCGRCVEAVLHVSSRWPQARGAKGLRQHTRETSAVRSHATPQRTQRGLPGSKPVAVVADAAWGRFCTSRRDGRKLGGPKGFRQHTRETSAVRSHAEPQRTQRGLPGSEPVAVVADAAWNRFCTSPRDGRKLGGRRDFGGET